MLDKRKFYINGKWIEPAKKNDFEVINPSNEESFAVISLGSKADVDLGVKVSKEAFETWKETTKEERIKLLENLLSIYKKRFSEMTEAISKEMGAPITMSREAQADSGLGHLQGFIEALEKLEEENKKKMKEWKHPR